jgi:hypothetical protein
MARGGPTASARAVARPGATRFDERLTLPWGWQAFGAVLAFGLGGYFTAYGGSAAVTYLAWALIVVAALAALWWLGRPRITVADGALSVGRGSRTTHRVELTAVRGAQVAAVRAALRPGCFAMTRPWVSRGVVIDTDRGRWVISSRRPELLVEALIPPAD